MRDFDYDIRRMLDTEHSKTIVRYIRESRCYCTFECAMSVNVLYSCHLWREIQAPVNSRYDAMGTRR